MVMAVMVVMMVMVLVTPARSSPVASSPPVLCLLRPRVASARRNTADRTRTQATLPQAQGCGAQRKLTRVPERRGSAPPPRPLRLLRALPRPSRRPLGSGRSAPTAPRHRLAGRAQPEPRTTGLARIPRRECPRPGPAPCRAPPPGHRSLTPALGPPPGCPETKAARPLRRRLLPEPRLPGTRRRMGRRRRGGGEGIAREGPPHHQPPGWGCETFSPARRALGSSA